MNSDPVPLHASETGIYAGIVGRPNPQGFVIVFLPALVAILLAAERKKSEPLTRAEVEALRDNASVAVGTTTAARAVEEGRGYADINADRAWDEWQKVRTPWQE